MKKQKQQGTKTNAMRILDQHGISYDTAHYEYDESDLSGNHAAEFLGLSEDEIFKTLVTRNGSNELFVFVVPVSGELDLKKAAVASGQKKLEMIHVKELVALTGYMRGGCTPIGMKKEFPTYVDETAMLFDRIYLSAGKRGEQIIMNADDLIQVVHGEYADLSK